MNTYVGTIYEVLSQSNQTCGHPCLGVKNKVSLEALRRLLLEEVDGGEGSSAGGEGDPTMLFSCGLFM